MNLPTVSYRQKPRSSAVNILNPKSQTKQIIEEAKKLEGKHKKLFYNTQVKFKAHEKYSLSSSEIRSESITPKCFILSFDAKYSKDMPLINKNSSIARKRANYPKVDFEQGEWSPEVTLESSHEFRRASLDKTSVIHAEDVYSAIPEIVNPKKKCLGSVPKLKVSRYQHPKRIHSQKPKTRKTQKKKHKLHFSPWSFNNRTDNSVFAYNPWQQQLVNNY